jgi:hypothetical protein
MARSVAVNVFEQHDIPALEHAPAPLIEEAIHTPGHTEVMPTVACHWLQECTPTTSIGGVEAGLDLFARSHAHKITGQQVGSLAKGGSPGRVSGLRSIF